MAGAKKKKKAASNPARGFATTSIASKQRIEAIDQIGLEQATDESGTREKSDEFKQTTTDSTDGTEKQQSQQHQQAALSPEQFEKQLEESELQLLVDKHAQKVRKDTARQIARLQTDRRLLRGQAETLITRKWLPASLTNDILQIIDEENRSNPPSTTDSTVSQKHLSEEDLTIRLWTLQQTLEGTGFRPEDVRKVMVHILNISEKIVSSNKDSIWGLDEALEWFAVECSKEHLPDYERWQFKSPNESKASSEVIPESIAPSGTSTPRTNVLDQELSKKGATTHRLLETEVLDKSMPLPSPQLSDEDSEIDPDELMTEYLATKTRLFHLNTGHDAPTANNQHTSKNVRTPSNKQRLAVDPRSKHLESKLKRIQNDVLFDQYIADQQWATRRIELEKEAAVSRSARTGAPPDRVPHPAETFDESDDEISKEAARIGIEVQQELGSDDDETIADLFASLPVTEIDPVSGKSQVVVNGSDGSKVTVRDFGRWTGVTPKRVLEEACRARDASVKLHFSIISEASFSNRHALRIVWSKSQDNLPESCPLPDVNCSSTPRTVSMSMTSVSAPDTAQSEAYIATVALFLIFSSSPREEKVYLRLPPTWRALWAEFVDVVKEKADLEDRLEIKALRDLVRTKRDREEEDGVILTTAFKRRTALLTPNDTSDESGSDKPGSNLITVAGLQKIWIEKSATPTYQFMLQSRTQLPMWNFKDEVLSTIDREQVVIICGETGCGKSTQVPSFILEHELSQGKACKIYCTEPRRISAISLARRVSEELGERKSDLGTSRSLVGYAIRLESNTSRETRLVYATTGIVMRMLESSGDLRDITHIVLDEVHERTIDSDFLLIVLRKLMVKRPDLKVVLMSATVDADRFSRYLDGAPVLQVPGRTFPVSSMFLEDAVELTGYSHDSGPQNTKYTDVDDEVEGEDASNQLAKSENAKALRGYSARTKNTIAQMDEYRIEYELILQLLLVVATDTRYTKYSKAVLVFLPGIGEIRQLNDMLLGHPVFSSGWNIYPLHSTIASEDQEAAFLVPSPGIRKIVLATNIAETGITIPDVTCVVDTGKHREMRFDERRQLSRLLETFISRANAKQRRGRAGRVQEGLCFHLFTKYRHDEVMADQQTPEMLRLSLQDLAIRVKICKLGGIEETLGQALDPPLAKNVRRAVDALIDVRALTTAEELTPLGVQLARLPLDVFLGKLILLGSIFKCLDATITIAAILSSKSPFSAPFGARSQADTVRLAFRRGDSDLLTVYNAYLAWKHVCTTGGSDYQFCRKNFLSSQTLSNIEDLKGQLVVCLVDSGFLPLTESERSNLNRSRFSNHRRRFFFDLPQRSNANSDNDLITGSVIGWSFYPKILVREGKGWRNVANNQSISLHPTSVNKGHHELNWLSYYHIMQAKQFYNAHETTAIVDFSIALLCGDVRADMYAGVFTLDGNRARFAISDWKTMLIIKTLRHKLREIMTRSFRNPGKPLTAQQAKWLEIWQTIFSQEELLKSKGYGIAV